MHELINRYYVRFITGTLLFLSAFLCPALPVMANSGIYKDFTWYEKNLNGQDTGEICIAQYDGSGDANGIVTIPAKIDGKPVVYYNPSGNYPADANFKIKGYAVEEGNSALYTEDGILFQKDPENGQVTLVMYPLGSNRASYTVPSGVNSIGSYAFQYSRIQHVVLPEGLTLINAYSFRDTQLEDISFPSSLKAIGTAGFSGTKLKELTIPGTVSSLGQSAFASCLSLQKVVIEKGKLRTLPRFLFNNDVELADVCLPEGLTTISGYAFANGIYIINPGDKMMKLLSLAIPSTVKTIEDTVCGRYFIRDTVSNQSVKVSQTGFVVYGEKGSAAEKYANANDLEFRTLEDKSFVDGLTQAGSAYLSCGGSAAGAFFSKEVLPSDAFVFQWTRAGQDTYRKGTSVSYEDFMASVDKTFSRHGNLKGYLESSSGKDGFTWDGSRIHWDDQAGSSQNVGLYAIDSENHVKDGNGTILCAWRKGGRGGDALSYGELTYSGGAIVSFVQKTAAQVNDPLKASVSQSPSNPSQSSTQQSSTTSQDKTGSASGNSSKKVTLPKKTKITSLKAASKAFTVKWKKQTTGTKGYQIQYSKSKKFKSGIKTVTVKNNKKTSLKIKKLKAKKLYYVRIRTYKSVGTKKYYSAWSAVKKVKTK